MKQAKPRIIVGVIGPAEATADDLRNAEAMGRLIAEGGWVLLSGGRDAGVMAASVRGADEAGGLIVGLLPDETGRAAPGVDVVIRTGLGSARNNVIALSADVLVACGTGAGTASEIALGIKAGTPLVLLGVSSAVYEFFRDLGDGVISCAESPDEAVATIRTLLNRSSDHD